jgi:hypothetical protein
MKSKVILLLLLILPLICSAQKKVVINNDTLITITPDNLKTINKMIMDLDYHKQVVEGYKELVKKDSVLLGVKDSLIVQYNIREAKKEQYYIDQTSKLMADNKRIKKEGRKRTTWMSIICLLVGAVVGVLVSK